MRCSVRIHDLGVWRGETLVLLLLFAGTSAGASPCLSYNKFTLEGVLSIESFTHGDQAETIYFVSPSAPFCIDAGKSGPAVASVMKVEIEINRKGGWPLMKPLLGHLVSCYGELYHSQGVRYPSTRWKDHHHSAVVLRGMCHAAA
jgi:hypothetical protein